MIKLKELMFIKQVHQNSAIFGSVQCIWCPSISVILLFQTLKLLIIDVLLADLAKIKS